MEIAAMISNADAPAGTLLKARSVILVDRPDGSLQGPIQAVDVAGGAITLLGFRVEVTSSTRLVTGRDGAAATLADFKVGDRVVAQVNVSGSALVAEEIRLLPPTPDTRVDGLVKSISPTSWVITGRDGKDVTVTVNAATKIEPGVNVGDAVHVAGTTDSSGNIVAWSIRKARTR